MNGEYGDDDDDFAPTGALALSQQFHVAVGRNDILAVHEFLGAHPDYVNVKEESLTPLMRAAFMGHREVACLLLDAGADIDCVNDEGSSALTFAAEYGRADVVECLLQRGANPVPEDPDNWSAEEIATNKGFARIVRLLREGVLPSTAALPAVDMPDRFELSTYGQAVNLGNLDVMSAFLGKYPHLVDAPVVFGSVALLRAVAHGQSDAVRLLLERGAQPNIADVQEGSTPLTRACWEGRMDIISLLLDAGADADMKSHAGLTPLIMAVCGRHEGVVTALLEAGADPLITNRQGRTPSQLAHVRGFSRMEELLAPYVEKSERRRADAELDRCARIVGRAHLEKIKVVKPNRSPFNKGGPKP